MDRRSLGRLGRAAAAIAPRGATVNVVVCTDREIRRLNRRYRGKDRPTDVLSFSYLYNDVAAPRVVPSAAGPVADHPRSLRSRGEPPRRAARRHPPSAIRRGSSGADDVAGDICISHETVVREAERLGVDPRHLFVRIAVHGLLHVSGLDHATGAGAARMERRERAVLRRCVPKSVLERLL